MNFYLAPLEGITTYIYRNAVAEFFGEGISKYFTPFFGPDTKRSMKSREMIDACPDNNYPGIKLIPQILTTEASDYIDFEKDMMNFGYDEVNINFGCPSNTVTAKRRGAAFLAHKDDMRNFLDEVYNKAQIKVSVKTRIGVEDPEEFYGILDIYNDYPVHELIIHPRVRKEMYSGSVHKDIYEYASVHSKNHLVYNGDIRNADDLSRAPEADTYMIGRGMIANPSLIRNLVTGRQTDENEMRAFVIKLRKEYTERYDNDPAVLKKLKELWVLMISMYPGEEKLYKQLMKSKTLTDYISIEQVLLSKKLA